MAFAPVTPKQEPDTIITARRPQSSLGLGQFLWALALFLVIIALLPGRIGPAVGLLVALGAVLGLGTDVRDFIARIGRGG